MPKSPNIPNKMIIKQSSNSNADNYQELRNIVKLMIVEAIKRKRAKQRQEQDQ